MPTYIYRCEDCGKEFEAAGSYEFLENYEPICPVCYKENIKKIIEPVAVIFKGKGFYKNDSKSEQ